MWYDIVVRGTILYMSEMCSEWHYMNTLVFVCILYWISNTTDIDMITAVPLYCIYHIIDNQSYDINL